MQLNNLKPKTKNKKKIQRGRGGKRGKTSGRGTKGQKARAGHKIRPEIRDVIRKLPKLRGYRFHSINKKPAVVSLALIENNFKAKDRITPAILISKRLIQNQDGKIPSVKIVASGEITKAVEVKNCAVSTEAKQKIEKVGGKVK